MPFSLLAPWFLGGLALLAAPILVHLTRRDRKPPVPFPSLMFLGAVPHESERRRRIRNWPLLLMRCLALALLALAFARPFVDRAEARLAPPGTGGREVVILLDRSYSMAAGDRWARATARRGARIAGSERRPSPRSCSSTNAARATGAPSGDRAALGLALAPRGWARRHPLHAGARLAPGSSTDRCAALARRCSSPTSSAAPGSPHPAEARLPAGARSFR